MRKLIPILALMVCTPHGYALADGAEMDDALPSDSRIKILMYDEADVYTVTTKYGYQTNIVFAPGEEVQTISVGDRSMWQIVPAGNRLFIRPMEDNVTTNMTVLTSKHSYQFDLKSTAAGKGGNIYVAKFSYPDDRPKFTSPPVFTAAPAMPMAPVPLRPTGATAYYAPPATHESPLPLRNGPGVTGPEYPNYNYTFDGPDDQAPMQVYDDGKSTFVKYRNPDQALPSPYVVDSNGNEKPVSYYIKDGTMVVGTVAGELALKGDGVVHVYNELLNPQS